MKYLKKNSGFTLVELLILVVILTIFLSAVLPLVVKNVYLNHQAKLKLRASQAAQVKIEDLRIQNFDTLENGSFSVPSISGATGTVQISPDINGDGVNETDIVKVKVTVTYTVKSEAKNVDMTTYISKSGIAK